MIPREILKKIRQIELRTNRIVQISSPVLQLFRLTACMENGQNHDAFGFNQKMDCKRKTPKNHRAMDFTANFWKPFWIVRDALKVLLDDCAKFLTQTFAFVFVIGDGIVEFLFRNATKDEAAFHLRYFASSFALTSANETTSSGFWRWSCKRRSINSASPGVSSFDPTMPSQRLRHSSTCSASGSARASFRTNSELMEFNLPPLNIFASA
jgi:hypothetical protein